MAQNRYKKLMGNTLIFAIGTFSSKVLVFLMLPYYTNILSTGEYGTVDALINVGQLMIPIASVGINNAVIRFGLEKGTDKSSVFSSGLYTILMGFVCLAAVSPVLTLLMDFMSGYTIAVLAFVLASSLRTLCIQFALSLGYNKMYAANGIGNTFLNVILNIILLPHFRIMGLSDGEHHRRSCHGSCDVCAGKGAPIPDFSGEPENGSRSVQAHAQICAAAGSADGLPVDYQHV